jgi:hypothetical protein
VERRSSSDGGGAYHAAVLYQFTVDGQTRSGNKVAFGDYGSGVPSQAQSIVNRYPMGGKVKVHYRTGDPDVCILEPRVHGQAWFQTGIGLILLVAGSLMAIYLPTMMQKSEMQAEQPPAEWKTNIQPKTVLNFAFGVIGLLFGSWAIHMGVEGLTPALTLSRGEIPVMFAMGLGGLWTGVNCMLEAFIGDRLPKRVRAVLLSGYVFWFASPFLLCGILTPEQIKSSIPGRHTGDVVFIAVGILLILLIPFFVRQLVRQARSDRQCE